jgi:hypothetical protein
MSRSCCTILILSIRLLTFISFGADRYVDLNNSQPVPPYTNWTTAAVNIQDAIDAAGDGELIWVTNGIYASGGRVLAGDLTNRVALYKAVTVRSVNGPATTTIQGAGPTNGSNAVRCAWVTNGATLQGFTLQWGATRTGGSFDLTVGGGAWCSSQAATVANCIIRSNNAANPGAGAYQGTLRNCAINWNNLNLAGGGAAVYQAVLLNCTVVGNLTTGTSGCKLTNCIVFGNTNANYSSGTWAYSCTSPLSSGPGNISADPQLVDGVFLSSGSPCRGAGTNVAIGTDLFGCPWANPPSIGCTEWRAAPSLASPAITLPADSSSLRLVVPVAGQPPFACSWMKDGVPITDDGHYTSSLTTTLGINWVRDSDAGSYQAVVSNPFGTATSTVFTLVIHFVDPAGPAPSPPYLSWAGAATNLQNAIDAALSGEIVLVTDGLYTSGLRVPSGSIRTRLLLDKPLLVQSVNGPGRTVVQGEWDPSGSVGPFAIRCAWLTNGAKLAGFTLQGGATWSFYNNADPSSLSGGGVLGISTNAVVANCILRGNAASGSGGGACQLSLVNCILSGNLALGSTSYATTTLTNGRGGGAYACELRNCVVAENSAYTYGGGAAASNLKNCAVSSNRASQGGGAYLGKLLSCTLSLNAASGGGAYSAALTNCIIYANQAIGSSSNYFNYFNCTMGFCCASPLAPGLGNTNADPLLLSDGLHLAEDSPCRFAGSPQAIVGADIDGQPWNNPPAIGCDEWSPAPAMTGLVRTDLAGTPPRLRLSAPATAGPGSANFFWLKDGYALQNGLHFLGADTPTMTIADFGPADSGAYWLIASNAFGLATSAVAQVVVHCVSAAGSAPLPPYADWSAAATNIQDAIDVAAVGDCILVTNGVYASGGRVMAGDLLNRVATLRPITVASMNGYKDTVILGALTPASTNGPSAVRCAWVGGGASLVGLTLRGGATRAVGDANTLQSGGGVCLSSGMLLNCLLVSNVANYEGGGCYQLTPLINQAALVNCRIVGNSGYVGGGACYCSLTNCLLQGNSATDGGGAYLSTLVNCTVTGNSASSLAGGIHQCSVYNSVVYGNWFGSALNVPSANWAHPIVVFNYSCSYPPVSASTPPTVGSIGADPELLDGLHPAINSPVRGAANAAYAVGADLDGYPWATPPSMGCFEILETSATGPLVVALSLAPSNAVSGGPVTLSAAIAGWANRTAWWFGDGSGITNISPLTVTHTWTDPGDYLVTFAAYNFDNPDGVATNVLIHVQPTPPLIALGPPNGNQFSLSFFAQAKAVYVVERTDSLAPPIAWQPATAITGANAQVSFTDTNMLSPLGFYRLRSQ